MKSVREQVYRTIWRRQSDNIYSKTAVRAYHWPYTKLQVDAVHAIRHHTETELACIVWDDEWDRQRSEVIDEII